MTAAAGSLWVSQETNVVARVDPGTLKVLARVPVKRNPLGSAVVRGQLWVPCIDSGVVVVIDPRTAKVVRELPRRTRPDRRAPERRASLGVALDREDRLAPLTI